MSQTTERASVELSELQDQLDTAINETDDEKAKFHIRKAAQHVVIAREQESG